MARKTKSVRMILASGEAVTATVMDGFVIDDLVTQGMRAEGYRVLTGKDVFPEPGRDLKDYLIKTGVLLA
jgi:hypothetical protein